MGTKPGTGARADQPSRASFKRKSLQIVECAILSAFVLSAVLLVISHQAVSSFSAKEDADKQRLMSVPLPPREAAKGGLPPIPNFVKQKLSNDEHDESYMLSAMENLDKGKGAEEVDSNIPTFPLPSDAVPAESVSSQIILKPKFGSHRPNQSAVFAFAEGYDLRVYATFIESLKQTGYTGDVVLAVSHVEGMKGGVEEYLKWYSQQHDDNDADSLHVVSYTLSWECYKKSGVRILPTNKEGRGSTTNNGFSDCKVHGLYSDGKDNTNAPADDPRIARPVATARYEMYWIWSKEYHENSSILIVDARDTYFQSNPFDFHSFPSLGDAHLSSNQGRSKECRLDLFEENYEAVDIGKSVYNSKWIKTAYGHKVFKEMSSKPVVCSGSTMGTQPAIELYSMAMVAQFDQTKCQQVGCDQGFHNYLFYEGGLKQYLASHRCAINVHKQGDGAVNNLAAMRTSSLRIQGVLKSVDGVANGDADDNIIVLQNDKSTPSPVLHQFDRDKELKGVVNQRASKMVTRWKAHTSGTKTR